MFENILNFFKKLRKSEKKENNSKETAKERLHLVLMQDRANVSPDFLDIMKQEIIEVIKKYVDVNESEIDVRMTNRQNDDGTSGAPALYANIPITNIRNDILVEKKKESEKQKEETEVKNEENNETIENKAENNTNEKAEHVSSKENNTPSENSEQESNEPIEETVNQN